MKKQTIGVEIEFTGITREQAARAIAKYFDTPFKKFRTPAGYDAQGTIDNTGRRWMIMSDCSIRSQYKRNGEIVDFGWHCHEGDANTYKCELVTPILRWTDLETLRGVVDALKTAGGFVNKSCGLHVHIGAKDFTAQGLRNLVNIVGTRDQLFYQVFGTYHNRKSYCRPTDTRIIAELNEKKPMLLDDVKNIWYDGHDYSAHHYDESRYTICNLHAFFSKGTIEFRVFNSTLEADEVMTAVHFTAAIVHFAKSVSHTVYKSEETASFKSARIRATSFFNKIGLTGDEFKVTQRHLLKNLKTSKSNGGRQVVVA